jgi:hypothetical protein
VGEKQINPELYRSAEENAIREKFVQHFRNCPLPDHEILQNLGLFLSSKNLARILFMDHLYQQIVDVHGIVMECGTRWGQNIALFSALRGIYEPFNRMRKIVGFDTFEGFTPLVEKDAKGHPLIKPGGFATTEGYVDYLDGIMSYHENDNPMSHVKKFELCKGDAVIEIDNFFHRSPETIVALAYFDFDIYEPTKACLQAIRPHLVKGSILAFDELSDLDSPGETIALDEVFGLNNIKLRRYRYAARVSYFIVE